jgi:hypothetical protein
VPSAVVLPSAAVESVPVAAVEPFEAVVVGVVDAVFVAAPAIPAPPIAAPAQAAAMISARRSRFGSEGAGPGVAMGSRGSMFPPGWGLTIIRIDPRPERFRRGK